MTAEYGPHAVLEARESPVRIMVIRVVTAEDSYLIREGVRLLLATQDDLELVASITNLPDLLAAVGEHAPDVVVTDIRMPPGNRDEGIRAAETLARSHPGLGVVVLSQYVEPEWALRLFDPAAADAPICSRSGSAT
jgi:DNA-binding NarL/FixJ family response regulator